MPRGVYELYEKKCIEMLKLIFFACSVVINVWNKFPNFISVSSLSALKRLIMGVNFSQFLKCDSN